VKTIVVFAIAFFSVYPAAGQRSIAASPAGDNQLRYASADDGAAVCGSNVIASKRNWRYTVHASDTLDLNFTMTPEFNQTVTVQPDGYITLRDIGYIRAAGQTLPELNESIKIAYSKILHNPQLSVDTKDFEKPFFVVGGQVGKPGKFDLRGDVTLTQAIAMAGGFTDASKHSQVLRFRRVSEQCTEAKIFNVKKMLSSRNIQEDPELLPGDMLFVPKNMLSKIKPFLPNTGAGMYYNPTTF
jgi:polysaccharide biosynthesis/export protein